MNEIQQQLLNAFLQREQARDIERQTDERIRALRNVLAGVDMAQQQAAQAAGAAEAAAVEAAAAADAEAEDCPQQ